MISQKFLNAQILTACRLLSSEAQYLYTLDNSFPDFDNSYYSDPRIMEMFKPVFELFVSKIEKDLDRRLMSRMPSPPPLPNSDSVVRGKWVDGELIMDKAVHPVIDNDRLMHLKPPGEADGSINFYSAVETYRQELFRDLKIVVAHSQKLKPPMQMFLDNPENEPGNTSESEYRIIQCFQQMNFGVLYQQTRDYEIAYANLEWDDVKRPYTSWTVDQSFAMDKTTVSECNKEMLNPEVLCKKYGLAYMTFPTHFSMEERSAYMNRFVEAADIVCEKMGYKDKAMFGQAGALGLGFFNYVGGTQAASYSSVANSIQIKVPSVTNMVHEYGHHLDHYIGSVAYETNQQRWGNAGYASSRLDQRVANPELAGAFAELYSGLDSNKHGYDHRQLQGTISNKTKWANVFKSIKSGDVLGAISSIRDVAEGKSYWNDRTEKVARAFDAFITQNNEGYRLEAPEHLNPLQRSAIGIVRTILPMNQDKMNSVFETFVAKVSPVLESQLTERCMMWNAIFNLPVGVKPPVVGKAVSLPPPIPRVMPPPLPRTTPPPLPDMGMSP